MGFTFDTAVTTDSDFLKYYFEQEVVNLYRGGNDTDELHKGQLNAHIAWLRSSRGIDDPSTIANDDDHLQLITAMVLEKIFRSITPPGGDGSKAAQYMQEVTNLRSDLSIRTAADGLMTSRGLPSVINVDSGTRFPPPGGKKGASIAVAYLDGFDEIVIQGE